jgi:NAD(P)-dependent dehydrogenase (short-subunit alcohol dehydrogenase family)
VSFFVAMLAAVMQRLPLLLYPPEDSPFSVTDVPSLSSGLNFGVTGANSGLGLGTVQHLVRAGTANLVVMACRNLQKCKKNNLQSCNSTRAKVAPVVIDISKRKTITKGALIIQEILADGYEDDEIRGSDSVLPLHVLVNNAGVMGAWDSREFIDNVETLIRVNHLGHVLVTHYLRANIYIGGQRANQSSKFPLWRHYFLWMLVRAGILPNSTTTPIVGHGGNL